MIDLALCFLCGEPMPNGETMFKYHGYSGRCPKPPLPKTIETAMIDRAEVEEKVSCLWGRPEPRLLDAIIALVAEAMREAVRRAFARGWGKESAIDRVNGLPLPERKP